MIAWRLEHGVDWLVGLCEIFSVVSLELRKVVVLCTILLYQLLGKNGKNRCRLNYIAGLLTIFFIFMER